MWSAKIGLSQSLSGAQNGLDFLRLRFLKNTAIHLTYVLTMYNCKLESAHSMSTVGLSCPESAASSAVNTGAVLVRVTLSSSFIIYTLSWLQYGPSVAPVFLKHTRQPPPGCHRMPPWPASAVLLESLEATQTRSWLLRRSRVLLFSLSRRQVRTAGFVSTIVPDNRGLRRNVCPGEKLNYD